MSVSSIGPILSRQNVERAVLTTLRIWFGSTYLPEVAAQNGLDRKLLATPSEGSFYGGVDQESWREQDLPAVVVMAEPTEDAIHLANAYLQWFEVTITTIVVAQGEDDARELADWYAAAVMATITQNDDLGGFATRTMLLRATLAEFVDPDQREFARAAVTFHTLVQSMVDETAGPLEPGWPPAPTPKVASTNLTVDAVPADVPVD